MLTFAAAALVGGWLLIRPKKAEAASCPILEDKIDAWGKAKDLYIMWLPDTAPPATWAALKSTWLYKEWPAADKPTPADTVVITHPNATFWSYNYPDELPQVDPEAKASYCAFTEATGPLPPPPPPVSPSATPPKI